MDPVLRALKYVRVPGVTVARACARYGITRYQYNRARKERAREITWTLDDILLSNLVHADRPVPTSGFVEYVDWQDHARYSEDELAQRLAGLAERGLVESTADGWRLCADWP